ncbi:hypothetical protein D8S78_00980 [Natrialba swarupiae]|nr:hypothetical protein [Natrialba swarupiae]
MYVCPNCAAEGMQYSTGCPSCSSVHGTWETTVVHPECGEPLEEPGRRRGARGRVELSGL